MLRRGFFYLLTMLGVIFLIGVITNIICYLFGIYIPEQGMAGILIMSAVMGFAGSVISLFLSKTMVKKSMKVQVIDTPRTDDERWLLQTVAYLAKMKGVNMPEVGIYPADEMNAFATGCNKDAALVAVSRGILNQMNRDELAAVLGHEMSHVRNGDMVTMALMQGIVNTFVYALSYIIASLASGALNRDRDEDNRGGNMMMFYMIHSVLQMLFGFLGTLAVLWFSRHREYAADAGSAEVLGKDKMIKALMALDRQHFTKKSATMQALCIAAGSEPSELMMSHPTIANRIAALQKLPH